jgi:threonine dehydrogenase-like Zn-dependent dehydrogenase
VVVVDVVPSRLAKAMAVGADAVINSAQEDLAARLVSLHGAATDGIGKPGKADTDVYLDPAGVPAIIESALQMAKHHAAIGVVAVHKKPTSVDFGAVLAVEPTIVTAMGYPTEIFED